MDNNSLDISIIIPVYGCPKAIPELYSRLSETLRKMAVTYEIIMVDDNCPLNSWAEIEKVCCFDKNVKGIHLSRNFGQGRAITAGISESTGKWVITMDCDLQDTPETIEELYNTVHNSDYDVVFVRRKKRKDSKITQFWAKLYHKVFSYLSEVNFDFDLATFLISSRRAADMFLDSKDRGRDYGMYLMWLGYNHTFVNMDQGDRHSGKSSYSFIKKMRYAIGTMTGFSNRILYVPIYLGIILSFISFIYLLYSLYSYFVLKINPEGWTSLIASISLFGGLILATLGIIGIYLGNVFEIEKDRPLYVIQTSINCQINGDERIKK